MDFFTDVENFKNEENPRTRYKFAKKIFYAYIKSPSYKSTAKPAPNPPQQVTTPPSSPKNVSSFFIISRNRKNSISSYSSRSSTKSTSPVSEHNTITPESTEFLSIQGSKELNLDSWMKKMIIHDFEQCLIRGRMNVDIFDRAQAQIFNIMQKDSFPRFCKSKGLEPPNQDYLVKSNSEEPVTAVSNSQSIDGLFYETLENEEEKKDEKIDENERKPSFSENFTENEKKGNSFYMLQSQNRSPTRFSQRSRRQSILHALVHKSPSKFSLPAQSKLFSPEKNKNNHEKKMITTPKSKTLASRKITFNNTPRNELNSITSNKLKLYEDCNKNSLSEETVIKSVADPCEEIEQNENINLHRTLSQRKFQKQGSKRGSSIKSTILNFGLGLIGGSRQRASTMSCQKF